MTILVVGSVALDTLKTVHGKKTGLLGGSAVYFSVAASFFTDVRLVGVVGDDFPQEHLDFLEHKNIDTSGLTVVKGGKTFHWDGEYGENHNIAITHDTQLGVFAEFKPRLPEGWNTSPYLFLGNIDPTLQLEVRRKMKPQTMVAMDTMNYWIQGAPAELDKILAEVDLLIINDGEAKLMSGERNEIAAAEAVLEKGPKAIVVKKGEHGVFLCVGTVCFYAPAYPLRQVIDPTGAGDTFAGGLMGYLASVQASPTDEEALRRACIYGSVMASFTVEDWSLDRLKTATRDEIDLRYNAFRKLMHF